MAGFAAAASSASNTRRYAVAQDMPSPLAGAAARTNRTPSPNAGWTMSAMAGDHATAVRFFEESLVSFRLSGYERGVAIALNNVGRSSIDCGDYTRAQEVLARAVAHARIAADLELASVALVNLAESLIPSGDYARAEEEASAALGFFKVSGNIWRQVECLKILGDLRRARGEPDVARRLYEQGLLLARRIDDAQEARVIEARLAALGGPNVEVHVL